MTIVLKCLSNRLSEVPERYLDERGGFTREKIFDLTPGKEYVAFGITTHAGGWWYYVEDDLGRNYPVWRPEVLFEVVDSTVPEHWIGHNDVDYYGQKQTTLSFPEWASDPYFYERLVDEDEAAVITYQAERAKLLLSHQSSVLEADSDLDD